MSSNDTTVVLEEQDYLDHMTKMFSDPKYAEWTEHLRSLWHRSHFVSHAHLPHSFLIKIYEAGYSPEEGLELYMRADAERYAQQMEALESTNNDDTKLQSSINESED
jgi:hypothetical protein